MKTLFIDCMMGAAGDMLTAALLELHPDAENFLKRLNTSGIPGLHSSVSKVVKCGIEGSQMSVKIYGEEEADHPPSSDAEHSHSHSHSNLHSIKHIIEKLNIPQTVKNDVTSIYNIIAEAESEVHNISVDKIHFHEVGNMDAIADITATALLIYELAPEYIVVSPVNVGSGQVRCAHGILPIPAPATALILKDIPTYSGDIQGELCTPTGAALLKYFAHEFKLQPLMSVKQIGYGMGKKNFEAANCVRILLGETEVAPQEVCLLECSIDDMTGEEISFACECLFKKNALDVYTTPIGMKKNRPAILLTCLTPPSIKQDLINEMFRVTTTLGIREIDCRRHILAREIKNIPTQFGNVKFKTASGFGIKKEKIEYEDLAKIARDNNITLMEAKHYILKENVSNKINNKKRLK